MSTQSTELMLPDTQLALSESYVSRQEQARLACEAAGIVWPGTILPPGTALYSSGVDKLKSDRAAWRRLPVAKDVIGLVGAALESEKRIDYPVDVRNLRFREDNGRMFRTDVTYPTKNYGLGYGPHTLRQLVKQIDTLDDSPAGFATALLYLDDVERAEILNKRLVEMEKVRKEAKAITLRTRVPHIGGVGVSGGRIARAALSRIYGSVTDNDIAAAIGEVMANDDKGKLDYKPGDARSRFEVIWPSEIPVETFVVGDPHYVMLSIGNSETGEGSLDIMIALLRAACANLQLSMGKGTNISIRHVGNPAVLIARLKQAIKFALMEVEPLIQTITMSARIKLGEEMTLAEAFEKIAKKYKASSEATQMWVAQHSASGYPATVWGLGNAISEAAHKRDVWTGEAEWEEIASKVMAGSVIQMQGGNGKPFEAMLSQSAN